MISQLAAKRKAAFQIFTWCLILLGSMIFGGTANAQYQTTITVSSGTIGQMSLNTPTVGNWELSSPGSLSVGTNTFAYLAPTITPSATGIYSFGVSAAPIDTVMILYSGHFNPAAPGSGAIVGNDDHLITIPAGIVLTGCAGSAGLCSALQTTLTGGQLYTLVVSHYASSDAASFALPMDFWCDGPANCGLAAPAPSVDALGTFVELAINRSVVQRVLANATASLINAMDYDCTTFNANGGCMSFQVRASSLDKAAAAAGVYTGAYRISPNLRVGMFVDYQFDSGNATGLHTSSRTPVMGAFMGFSSEADGTGLQAKLSFAYSYAKANIAREAIFAETEPGQGASNVTGSAVALRLGWAMKVDPTMIVTPYVGIRRTEAARGGYTEDSNSLVTLPVTYNAYIQRLTTASLGLRVTDQLTDTVSYMASVAAEYDVMRPSARFSGSSGIAGLDSFSMASAGNGARLHPVGMAGLAVALDGNQRLISSVTVRGNAYSTQPAATAMAGYELKF